MMQTSACSRPVRRWKAPRVVELSVGMEINGYFCATA